MNDKQIIICDIDGTIANLQHRLHYIRNPEGTKDWDSFHVTCTDDKPYEDVIRILWDLYDAGRRRGQEGSIREVYFFSGRNEAVRPQTIRWLWRHVLSPSMCHEVEITPDEYKSLWTNGMAHTLRDHDKKLFQLQPYLCMRSEGDRRPDTTVKYEMMYDYKFMPEDVLCILDDRQGVVDMWRQEGFRCLQVDAWKEPTLTISETRKKDELVQWADDYRETHEEPPKAHTWGGGKSALLDQHQPTMPTPRTLDVATKNLSEIEENDNES
jgi:hypothetical protein